MLQLTLPLPPSVNTYYKKYRNKLIISPAGQEFRKNVINLVDSIAGLERFNKNDRLLLEVRFYPPDNRRRDLDNFCGKALQDALQHAGVYPDDSQLDVVSYCRMQTDKKWPRVEVTLDKIDPDQDLPEENEYSLYEFNPELVFLLMEKLAEFLDGHIADDPEAVMIAVEEDPEFPRYEFQVFLDLIEHFHVPLMNEDVNPDQIGVESVSKLLEKLQITENINWWVTLTWVNDSR